MKASHLENELIFIENVLKRETYDFTAKYMAVCQLQAIIQPTPEIVRPEIISALEGILKNSVIARQTQSYFLFKEASEALCSIITCPRIEKAKQAYFALLSALTTSGGHSHRAAAGALGSLPFLVEGPKISQEMADHTPHVNWQDILEVAGVTAHSAPVLMGRSLVVTTDQDHELLVVKLASGENSLESIYREAAWVEHLCSQDYYFPLRFNIPEVLKIKGSTVFRLEKLPARPPEGLELHPEGYAIAFTAHRDYFTYPNGYGREGRLSKDEFREVMFRNAWLFGRLTSLGIVHSAPVPLFHNRVQGLRRPDHGLYEWQRAGRLDRWLDSCRYPNFGVTGIRDFEHLIPFRGLSRNLYRHIGEHLLSLFLVTGSFFRNKDREKIGIDSEGKHVDARDLFDRPFLREIIQGVFLNYYSGFVGVEFSGELPFDFDKFTERMIDEMGVDRHMEEILRVVDQAEMTDEEFMSFLEERGYTEKEVKEFQKGEEDIIMYTGPHLGGFNQRISLPELIETVGSMSALCIFGRYWREKSPEFEI